MFTLSEYQQRAKEALVSIYGDREAMAIVKLWFESRLNMSRIDLTLRRGELVEFSRFEEDLMRLQSNTPIQLILEEAYFLFASGLFLNFWQ